LYNLTKNKWSTLVILNQLATTQWSTKSTESTPQSLPPLKVKAPTKWSAKWSPSKWSLWTSPDTHLKSASPSWRRLRKKNKRTSARNSWRNTISGAPNSSQTSSSHSVKSISDAWPSNSSQKYTSSSDILRLSTSKIAQNICFSVSTNSYIGTKYSRQCLKRCQVLQIRRNWTKTMCAGSFTRLRVWSKGDSSRKCVSKLTSSCWSFSSLTSGMNCLTLIIGWRSLTWPNPRCKSQSKSKILFSKRCDFLSKTTNWTIYLILIGLLMES